MFSELQLIIYGSNDKILDKIAVKTNTSPPDLLKSLVEFQQSANDGLSKLIVADSAGGIDDDYFEDESDKEEVADPVTPKKRKNN